MKIKRILLILTLVAFGLPAAAQNLDSSIYGKIKSELTTSRHAKVSNTKATIEKLTNTPVIYLKAISEDATLRIYVREKAIALLKYYPSEESESILKGKIEDANLHKSLRSLAVRSFSSVFYEKDPQKAEVFLGSYKNDKSIGKAVETSLQEARYSTFRKHTPPSKEDFEKYKKFKTLNK